MTDTSAEPPDNGSYEVAADPDPPSGSGYAASLPTEDKNAAARRRALRRLEQARTSLRAGTIRVRSSASLPSRRTVVSHDDNVDTVAVTFVDRGRAYRAHILSAAVAIIVVLAVVRSRRAAARRVEDTVDLGKWNMHGEPIGEE